MSASSDRERVPQRQLGELMTELGLITDEQLATVLEVQQRSKRPLGQIIVELGFASGAAVAHALAMQSGGALRTEYGFALGVHSGDSEPEPDGEETATGLPKLRLASGAAAPPVKESTRSVEETASDERVEIEPLDDALLAALPAGEPEATEELVEVEEAEEEIPVAELEEIVPDDVESATAEEEILVDEEVEPVVETDPADLSELRAEIERLETALAAADAAAAGNQERLRADVAKLESLLAETHATNEQRLAESWEERDNAKTELERLQATLAGAESAHEQERATLWAAVAEAQAAAAEHQHRLTEERERQAGERDELATHRDRLQQELGDALERLATIEPAAEECDRLRGEQQRLLGDVDRLESALAESQSAHKQELVRLQQERDHAVEEVEHLRAGVAEAQTSAAEHERRLVEEIERHSVERDELGGLRDRLQAELGEASERLAALGAAAEERDELRAELERVNAANAETQEECAVELRELGEERDSAQAELAEAREMLVQAERVRESQIALTTERDRALAELEQLRIVAAEAQAEAEERSHLLAEEQDRHHAERESLIAQRGLLEHELGDAIERLAATASAADRHEEQLQLAAARLRALAADLVSEGGELREESELETETKTETELVAVAIGSEPEKFSLFVPGPNGYELVPQTGVPPQAGETIEVVPPDGDEPTLYEVARCARTLPGGGLCVYLAPR